MGDTTRKGETILKYVLIAALAALVMAGSAQAHQQSKGSTEHQLQLRIIHDHGVIRSVDRQAVRSGSWLFLEMKLWLTRQWHERDLARATAQLQRNRDGWLISAFTCIHRGEGGWNANTGNGYYGGLQFDYGFQRAYGAALLASKGTANNWTPMEQISVAIRAYKSGRGFYPWPATARGCGLI